MADEFLCLKCPLKECNDTSPQCLYRVAGRVILEHDRYKKLTKVINQAEAYVSRMRLLRGKRDRSEYWRSHYLKNRETKLERANRRNALRRSLG